MANSTLSIPANGYIDLQVNGFAGVDLNSDDLTLEGVQEVCRCLQADGAAGFLPTVITADLDAMAARLSRLVELRQADPFARKMIPGFHIEGPFISAAPGCVGAHPVSSVRAANLPDVERLLEASDGLARIVTLAPEHDPGLRVTRFLADQGVTVAAGHCDPTLDQLRAAIDAGVTMFTHLGNGCPHLHARHDNIVQRVLSLSERLTISFIADGLHVPFYALGNYLRAAGTERCVIVSDAISAAGLGTGSFSIGGQPAVVGEDGVPRAPDSAHFVGSATSLSQMADNLRRHLRVSEDEIQHLVSIRPRALLER